MNFFIQSLPIILLLASYSSVTALKWAAPHPITVEGDVIRVNKPTKLTCDYVKNPRETVKEVKWTYVQGGLRAPVKTANNIFFDLCLFPKIISFFRYSPLKWHRAPKKGQKSAQSKYWHTNQTPRMWWSSCHECHKLPKSLSNVKLVVWRGDMDDRIDSTKRKWYLW